MSTAGHSSATLLSLPDEILARCLDPEVFDQDDRYWPAACCVAVSAVAIPVFIQSFFLNFSFVTVACHSAPKVTCAHPQARAAATGVQAFQAPAA